MPDRCSPDTSCIHVYPLSPSTICILCWRGDKIFATATCIHLYLRVEHWRIHVDGYKLLVRDTCIQLLHVGLSGVNAALYRERRSENYSHIAVIKILLYPRIFIDTLAYYPRRLRRSAWVERSVPSVCLFVCLFVRITQKRMIRKCSNLVQEMTLDILEVVWFGVERSKVKVTGSINPFCILEPRFIDIR